MTLTTNIRLEREVPAIGHDRCIDVMVEIDAPEATAGSQRRPASVALVVDESGSMRGEKLLTAKRCLAWLAGRLRPDDRVALVGFETDAWLHLPLSSVGCGHEMVRAVAQLGSRGSTNLSGGLLMGLEALEAAADAPRSVLLLTDGWANRGVTDMAGLVAIAARAAARGRTVGTIGFGSDFSEDLLSCARWPMQAAATRTTRRRRTRHRRSSPRSCTG